MPYVARNEDDLEELDFGLKFAVRVYIMKAGNYNGIVNTEFCAGEDKERRQNEKYGNKTDNATVADKLGKPKHIE